jgi:hypothetical protein
VWTAGRPLITTPTITNTPIYRATSMTVLSASTGLHFTLPLVAPRKRLMDFLYNTHNPDSSSKHSIPKSGDVYLAEYWTLTVWRILENATSETWPSGPYGFWNLNSPQPKSVNLSDPVSPKQGITVWNCLLERQSMENHWFCYSLKNRNTGAKQLKQQLQKCSSWTENLRKIIYIFIK